MNALRIVGLICALIGFGALAGAYYAYHNTNQFAKTAITTEGTVIELVRSSSHRSSMDSVSSGSAAKPVVEFFDEAGNRYQFTSSIATNPPAYVRGEKVQVIYQPDNPHRARIDSMLSKWLVVGIFGIIGSIFAILGLGMAISSGRSAPDLDRLRRGGRREQATVTQIALDRTTSVEGQHPYRIIAQWHDPRTNQVRIFRSEDIWFDPTSYVTDQSIAVFIDPDNPSKYSMDLSFLPQVSR